MARTKQTGKLIVPKIAETKKPEEIPEEGQKMQPKKRKISEKSEEPISNGKEEEVVQKEDDNKYFKFTIEIYEDDTYQPISEFFVFIPTFIPLDAEKALIKRIPNKVFINVADENQLCSGEVGPVLALLKMIGETGTVHELKSKHIEGDDLSEDVERDLNSVTEESLVEWIVGFNDFQGNFFDINEYLEKNPKIICRESRIIIHRDGVEPDTEDSEKE